MTISSKDRTDSVNAALRRMLDELGGHWIGEMRFEVKSDHFSDLPQTTWLEMQERSWVKPSHDSGGHAFKLTGAGLVAALQHTGEIQSAEHKERCVRLKAALADLNKARELQGTLTDTYELTARTGLPDRWIWNAIDARFLAHEWPKHHVDVESRGRDVRIPGNFGSERLWGLESGPLLPIPEDWR